MIMDLCFQSFRFIEELLKQNLVRSIMSSQFGVYNYVIVSDCS